MTASRYTPAYPMVTGVLLRALCIALVIAAVGTTLGAPTARAQIGGPVLTVYAEPASVMPGQSVTFTVIASGAGSSAAIDVDVPNELTISEDVDCVHSTLFCDDSSISTLDADTNRLSVTAPGALPGPDGPRATARVTITFSVSVPSSAVPGTRYEIISSVRGLFNLLDPTSATDKQVSTFLNVLDGSGQRVAPQPTPSPTVEPASSVAGDAQIIRFEIDQGDIIPVTSIVPGGEATFNVYQGFRNCGRFVYSEPNIVDRRGSHGGATVLQRQRRIVYHGHRNARG